MLCKIIIKTVKVVECHKASIYIIKGEIIMDFRKVFDSITEEFDKWRNRYWKQGFGAFDLIHIII